MSTKRTRPLALIFTANGSGLGHVSRAVKIANAFARRQWSVLVITGNPAANYLSCDRGVDIVRIPCLEKSRDGSRKSRTNYSDTATVLQSRRSLILTLAVESNPSLLIVDHKPAGIAGELLDTLWELKTRNVPRVLLLRDFGGDLTVARRTWDQDNAWSALQLYSQVVILGRESAYDWSSLISHVKDNVPISYLGFLVANRKAVANLSERSGSLIIGGGGAHAYELFLTAINDLICVLPHPVTLCTGPLMDPQDRTRVSALANKNATVKEYIPSLERHLHSFQVTISQAGSISSELAYSGVNTVLVPRDQESREQHMRALYWAQSARHIHLSDLNGLLNQVTTLRREVNCNAPLLKLRNALSDLFVTPATVVKSILNEVVFNN